MFFDEDQLSRGADLITLFFTVPNPLKRLPFGPLIQKDFVDVPSFTDDDWSKLEGMLGAKIPENDRERIDAACELFVNSVVLHKQMATWKQLRDVLAEILVPANKLLDCLRRAKPSAVSNGTLPADQVVGTFITLEFPTVPHNGFEKLVLDLSQLVAFVETALMITKKGPGTGEQAELRFFLNTLAEVAMAQGIPTKLPGHDEFAKVDPSDETAPAKRTRPAFFQFVREALRLANAYGKPGISKATLPQEERNAAITTLEAYARKTDKALSKQLERIRGDVRAV